MKKKDLVIVGEAFERLSKNPDYECLCKAIQTQIQLVASQIHQGSFKKFPDDYWKATGELRGLARADELIRVTIKTMNDLKKGEEKRAKR